MHQIFGIQLDKGKYMNALKAHLKHKAEKEHEEFLKKLQEEKEAYEKMTPEEKEKYDKEKAKDRKKTEELLMTMGIINSLGKY